MTLPIHRILERQIRKATDKGGKSIKLLDKKNSKTETKLSARNSAPDGKKVAKGLPGKRALA